MGFGKIFDRVFSSAEIGYKKPQAEFFDSVMSEIGFKKEKIQFWDDMEKNVLGAKDFGLDARLYAKFEDFDKQMVKLIS
jgi:putative hydrolase of the HAD superfamily